MMKKLFLVLFVFVAVVMIVGCTKNTVPPFQEKYNGVATLVLKYEGNTEIKSYNFDDTTAYDLLKIRHIVEVEDSSIKCINELCGNDGYKWNFYINREQINASPITYKIRNNDMVEFRFE